ncbi:GyrI-like domain-containing protein [Paenarthrobacter sp. NPDC018779]|uniref:GyrI-like domain-containing protein n=1 Tax=Paenarthrobacter sp. NPDC018779 TaxID=3364375 RepID=UPI0037C75F7F
MGGETKIDFKREIHSYKARAGQLELVTVPPLQFLMVDGHGDPNTAQSYTDALSTLYPVAYTLKFFSKKELGRDYAVMPLEGLWWSGDMASFTSSRDKSKWDWTMMIMAPDWITPEHVDAARDTVAGKGGAPALDSLRLESLDEGLAVQTLHVGPYDAEGPVLEEMHHGYIPENSLRMTGKHHEIYLSDARRTAPEKLKTILRQPVTRN